MFPEASFMPLPRCGIPDEEARRAVDLTLDRIGNEDLFLFKDSIRGEKDLAGLRLAGALESWLKERWRDRALVKSGDGYAPAWSCRSSRAWASLSEGERASLEHALAELSRENGDSWIRQGKGILSMLASASEMLPCAEDLGAIPDGVPQALASLGMLGLRLPRWTRRWNEHGQPYISLRDYPELSVCTPSVHDTTTLRDWWRLERGREAFAMAYCPVVAGIGEDLDCDAQYELLRSLAGSSSRICMLQAQDLLDLEEGWRSEDPAWDRVNIPGTTGEFNWTWRMKPSVGELEGNARWLERVRGIAQARSRR